MSYFYPADILLPKKDLEKWAVIACDQYTSDPSYWEDVSAITKGYPSALNIVLPEVYLKQDNRGTIERINHTMKEYLDGEIFTQYQDTMIYVERTIGDQVRKGLIGVIDLEDYDYHKNSVTPIRATEETVESRLPARIQIRENAFLEMPHILILFDDPTDSVLCSVQLKKETFQTAYDFELMKNGGHIHGRFLDDGSIQHVQRALQALQKQGDGLLFVVGDGNHSLAAAKECYERTRNPKARYALVEIENVYDSSIHFEPIYRVFFHVDEEDFLNEFQRYTETYAKGNKQTFRYFSKVRSGTLQVHATAKLPVGTLQTFADTYLKEHPQVEIDYIHGTRTVKSLCQQEHTLGFIYEGMEKDEIFPAVREDGALPKKTFSMGHADEKRFYIEARRIK